MYTSDGNFVLVGAVTVSPYTGSCHPAILKVDKNGKIIWAKMFELKKDLATVHNRFTNVIELSDESYLAVGYSKSNFNNKDGAEELIALNILPNGNIRWFKAFGRETNNEQTWPCNVVENEDNSISISGIVRVSSENVTAGFSLDIDSKGNVISEFNVDGVGWYTRKYFKKLDDNSYIYQANMYYRDNGWFDTLKRYDANRSLLWSKAYYLYYPEAKKNLNITEIKYIQVDDGFICAGDTESRMPFIFKIDDNGNVIWGKLLKSESGITTNICPSLDNGAFVTLKNGYSTVGMTVIKVSEKGDIKWAKNYGSWEIFKVLNPSSDMLCYTGYNSLAVVNSTGDANFVDNNNREFFVGKPINDIEIKQVEIKTVEGVGPSDFNYKYNTTKSMDITKYFAVKTDFSINTAISLRPEIQVEKQTLNFGNVKANSSQSLVLNISNNGLGMLKIDSISITGANSSDFKLKNTLTSIKSKQKEQLVIIANPKTAGLKKATLNITSNDPLKSHLQIQLICNALNPSGIISISEKNVNFGTVSIGNTYKKTITISNLGSANLKISAATIGGTDTDEFSFEANKVINKILKPKEKISFNVILKPKTRGTKSAYITITSNDVNKKSRITLTAQVK
ncbi:choice-of-anchor D domain-containing protein [Caldicellulosiruptor morganii]|uniref:Choice-of-anchor D domain-containing protein n=2 Tax=Caldicellulosiruptor morganii TaxID=1387555 RepID=A0ABY7BN92_9FIRM|nr:choice-of-anchor D domain-containing protein [Caldicellulosiruptor morganii]WAM34285.1 choice-of-anchor D domain-containing protein [Caldicellulosiruptor morganii]